MFFILRHPNPGEFMVAWQEYIAKCAEELTLNEGDVVELIDTDDNPVKTKKLKLDPSLGIGTEHLLDNAAAKHKLSLKPKRSKASARQSPTRHPLNARWLVREVKGQCREGWVPCQVLQSVDEPVPGSGLPGDAAFRRQAVVKELVETEQEFVRDLDFVVQKYLIGSEKEPRKPKIIKDNFDLIFGNLKEISEFHRIVLMEGVKYYANEPHLLGKAFLRLERDFDKHVNYCKEEPLAQAFLDECDIAREYFDEVHSGI